MDHRSMALVVEPIDDTNKDQKQLPVPLRSLPPAHHLPAPNTPDDAINPTQSICQMGPARNDIERSSPSPEEGRETEEVQSFSKPPKNRYRVIASNFTSFGLGLNDSAPGALIPYIESGYGIGYAVVSLLFVANALGFISAAFFINTLTIRVGRAKTLMIGESLMMVGYVLIVSSLPFPVTVVGFFLTGMGMATVLAIGQVFNAILDRGPLLTGFFQGSYGIGGITGPLMATALVSTGIHWSRFYTIPLGLAALNLLFNGWSFWNYEQESSIGMNPPSLGSSGTVTGNRHWQSFKSLVLDKTTLLGSLFIFAYQGCEVAISGWVISFLVNYRGGDPSKVGYVTAGFWAGITLGRFTLSHIGSRIGERIFVLGLTAGAFILQLLMWFIPSVIGDSIAVSLAGLLLGPIYPAAVQLFVRLLPRQKQVAAFSFIASVGTSGGAFVPFMTGLLSQEFGTWMLHPVCIVCFVFMTICWLFLPKINKRSD